MKTIHKQITDRIDKSDLSRSAFADKLDQLGIISRSQALRFFAGACDTGTITADLMLATLAKIEGGAL